MLMAVFTTFATSRKEPLGETVARIQAAFEAAGFGVAGPVGARDRGVGVARGAGVVRRGRAARRESAIEEQLIQNFARINHDGAVHFKLRAMAAA